MASASLCHGVQATTATMTAALQPRYIVVARAASVAAKAAPSLSFAHSYSHSYSYSCSHSHSHFGVSFHRTCLGWAISSAATATPHNTRHRQHQQRMFSTRISMSLRTGIVGLPNVGKSTLFNALVENGKAQAANFPFCTIEPNVGIVALPDHRLHVLSQINKSQKTVPTSMEFVDIAGLVKGASQGEVVRCFEDNDIVHVNGKVDPKTDIDIINLELAFSDLEQIEKRMEKLKRSKPKDSQTKLKEGAEMTALQKIHEALMGGKPARSVTFSDFEKESIRHLCLLTMKPVIFAANVAESDLRDPASNIHVNRVAEIASDLNSEVVTVSAQVEAELVELQPEERTEYLKSLGVSEGGLGSLVRATYNVLGLQTYFTSGEKETKAWTILAGMTAPQAAGVIHSDFEKGFIRAETVSYDDYVAAGSFVAAKENGLVRSEGKDYVVQEGDVMLFRFNV